jgi:hypothetical protein
MLARVGAAMPEMLGEGEVYEPLRNANRHVATAAV